MVIKEGFKPLYVVNKRKPEQKCKTLVHDEVKHLLQNFIHRALKYKGPVDLEFDIGIEAQDEISNLICDEVALSKKQPKPKPSTNTSSAVPSIDITKQINNITPNESIIERDGTATSEKRTFLRRPIEEKMLTDVTKRIRRSGSHSEKISDDSYECCTYDPPADGSCFYWCIKHLVTYLANASTKHLRSMTAFYIENDPNLRLFAPQSHATNPNISISDYCASVRGNMFAGDPECTAMMALCCQEIFVFVIDTESETYWEKSYKFDDRNVSGRIYLLLFDKEKHFQALYMKKKTNPDDQIKEFSSSDETARHLFRKHIETSTGVKLKDDSRSSSKKRKGSNMHKEHSSFQLGPIVKRPRVEIKSTMNSSSSQSKTHFLGLKIMLKADLTKLTPCTFVIQLVSDNLVRCLTYKFRVQEAGDNKITYCDEVRVPLSIDKREITLTLIDTSRSHHPPIQEFTQCLDFYEDTQSLLTTLELGQYPTFQQARWIHGLSFKMFLTGECSGAYAAIDYIDKILIASRYISNLSSSRISCS